MIALDGVERVWEVLPQARIAGGAVRDFLGGRPIADVDFAVPLPPATVMAQAGKAGLKVIPTGLAHGTVTVMAAGRAFEVTSLRRDVSADGRHAVVEYTDDWQIDASRRDFTINAMSMTRDGRIHDYFGGRDDLAAGRVRFVGVAKTRIAEDFLRILRFFRFYARYGRGAADAQAMAAIKTLRFGIATLSAERVWSEAKKILGADDPRATLALMRCTGVLGMLFKDADTACLERLVAANGPTDGLLRAAALLRETPAAFAQRWKLSGAEHDRLAALLAPAWLTPAADDADLRRALAAEPAEILVARSWLVQNDQPGWAELRARLQATPRPVFPLQGRDVTALGIAPGPEVGEILREVFAWWRAGGCVADTRACLQSFYARQHE